MATTTRAPGALNLELAGQAAGALRSLQPASLRVDMESTAHGPVTVVRRGARVSLGEMVADADLPAPGPLLDWLQAALAGNMAPLDGAVLQADATMKLRRRIGFAGARLTGLAWPALDATIGRQPVTLALRWLVEAVDDAPASGGFKLPAASKRKAMVTSNFRLKGLPFGASAVVRVELPTLQVDWAGDRTGAQRDRLPVGRLQLGEVAITVGQRDADAARAWVHKLVADGSIGENDGLLLQVDLLDAALKSVLASVELRGCLLAGMDESPLGGASADRLPSLRLRFNVGGIKLGVA